uniref:N-acetyltransferase domain-containing protein n=1 Tax=Hemiselmis andersenii TaxID=464988 RepID=A0A6U5BYZ4_HEMAN
MARPVVLAIVLALAAHEALAFSPSLYHSKALGTHQNTRLSAPLPVSRVSLRPGRASFPSSLQAAIASPPVANGPVVIEEVDPLDVPTIKQVAAFFVGAFWQDYKAQALMTDDQKRRFCNEQFDDMRIRYGAKSPVNSSLVIARNGPEGEIVGCVGLEMALVMGEKILPKNRENLARNYDMQPLLANLAVSPAARRQGLARKLCVKGEEVVRGWGQDHLLLLVEEGNEPAIRLYRNMGYKQVWSDPTAKASMPVDFGGNTAMQTVTVTNVAMTKPIKAKPGLLGLGLFGVL